MVGYPKWFSKRFISISFFILAVTGFFLIPNTLNHRFDFTVPLILQGTLRLAVTSLHTLMTYIFIFIVGGISVIHARNGLKKNRNKVSGLMILTMTVLLVLSGLGVLYFGNENLISLSSIVHILAGVQVSVFYFVHFFQKK
ncbi:MAG: hypothetical protein JNM39_17375 [Bdellovibrionaceae bacterium]|nr:hypothetical protein [Pseudobdellovibrionaceae bacterium]